VSLFSTNKQNDVYNSGTRALKFSVYFMLESHIVKCIQQIAWFAFMQSMKRFKIKINSK